MESLGPNHTVLFVTDNTDNVNTFLDNLRSKNSNVTTKKFNDLENLNSTSTYDFIICRFVSPMNNDGPFFTALLKAAKPGANIIIRQQLDAANQIASKLKLNGFTNISNPRNISEENVTEISCCKPNFEVGSSAPLNLKAKSSVSNVWKLDDTVDDEVETIDPDDLLDEDDLKKPDAPLRVCNTTGKRKACKDCSCGLADELASENGAPAQNADMPKSSCGSCYLGDAFRCATCPYRGMPAFKPGEKIQLSADQLKADL